jgi:hypothetical protein
MLQHAVQFAALAETASELRQPLRRIFDVLLAVQQDRYDRGDPARHDDAGQPVETLSIHDGWQGKARSRTSTPALCAVAQCD